MKVAAVLDCVDLDVQCAALSWIGRLWLSPTLVGRLVKLRDQTSVSSQQLNFELLVANVELPRTRHQCEASGALNHYCVAVQCQLLCNHFTFHLPSCRCLTGQHPIPDFHRALLLKAHGHDIRVMAGFRSVEAVIASAAGLPDGREGFSS